MSSITIMTTQGRAQLAAAVANAQSFPSAMIAVGDGNGATYVPNEAQVALVHEVWRGNATVARTDDRVIFQAVVPAEIGGFTVREVGVLIGEAGAEQLFIVSQHPSTEKIAAPANGSGPLPVTLAFSASASEQAVLPIGSSDNATLQLSRAPHITVDGLVSEPPAEPADGTLFAIAAGATGLFVGKGGWLVERVAGAWIYKQPPEKSVIRLATNGAWYQRDGGSWAVLTFEDTSILWAQILDPPAEFPPSAHDHDDRYFTEAEADGRFVQKNPAGGATQVVEGTLGVNVAAGVNSFNFLTASATKYTFALYDQGGGNYGLGVYGYGGGAGTGWRALFDHNGYLGLGTLTPNHRLHVNGNIWSEGFVSVTAPGNGGKMKGGNADAADQTNANVQIESWWGIGFAPSIAGQWVPQGENAVWIDARSGHIGLRGSFQLGGTLGTAAHVLVGGSTASWKSLADLFTLGAVGSFGFFKRVSEVLVTNPGDVIAGSDLEWSGASHASGYFDDSNISPAGSWRCMGYVNHYVNATLYVRIA